MHAILLVGGKGTRLVPYTSDRPKALLKVGRYPLLEVIVRRLRAAGCDRVTMCISHLGHLIEEAFGDGSRFGLRIEYAVDETPLGTAAPLRQVARWDSPAVVMNGDVLSVVDFADLFQSHLRSSAEMTVVAHRVRTSIAYGVLEIGGGEYVEAIQEKPELRLDVAAGVYVVNPSVRAHVPPGTPLDMPDLIGALVRHGHPVRAYRFDGLWHDIGTAESYHAAQRSFSANESLFLGTAPQPVGEGVGDGSRALVPVAANDKETR